MWSRSSRLPMSPATRRRASARWSRWATSSSRRTTPTMAPMASARTATRSRSAEPKRSRGAATIRSAPHGPSRPGIAAASSSRSPGSDAVVTRSVASATTVGPRRGRPAPGPCAGRRRRARVRGRRRCAARPGAAAARRPAEPRPRPGTAGRPARSQITTSARSPASPDELGHPVEVFVERRLAERLSRAMASRTREVAGGGARCRAASRSGARSMRPGPAAGAPSGCRRHPRRRSPARPSAWAVAGARRPPGSAGGRPAGSAGRPAG